MNNDYLDIVHMTQQYMDLLNLRYVHMTKEIRLKSLASVARRIAEFDSDREHDEIRRIVEAGAKEYGCAPHEIELKGIDYPEDIVW
jgi:hypothetical protein